MDVCCPSYFSQTVQPANSFAIKSKPNHLYELHHPNAITLTSPKCNRYNFRYSHHNSIPTTLTTIPALLSPSSPSPFYTSPSPFYTPRSPSSFYTPPTPSSSYTPSHSLLPSSISIISSTSLLACLLFLPLPQPPPPPTPSNSFHHLRRRRHLPLHQLLRDWS